MLSFEQCDFTKFTTATETINKRTYHDNIFTLDFETTSIFFDGQATFAFDETQSADFYKGVQKIGFLYIWQLSIDGQVFFGRTCETLLHFLHEINFHFPCTKIFYIHNLGFEFQFLRNLNLTWDVFARKPRHPIKAYCSELMIELRCSMMLYNTSLEQLPKNIKLNVEKKIGQLDYSKIRHAETFLSDEEMEYCEYDCVVLDAAIRKTANEFNGVYNIPLTQTGKVRKEVKALYKKDNSYYSKIIKMQPLTYDEFFLLTASYSGGYTHANALHVDKILHQVRSYDIASSYPAVMCYEKFPMSKFIATKISRIDEANSKFAYIYDITFFGLRCKISNVYLSKSKALELFKSVEDNGRLVTAEKARYILTDIDLEIVRKTYDFEYEINGAYKSLYSRLDTKLVHYILQLYANKTTLKGVTEFDDLYRRSKEYINAIYGMSVTNTVRDEVLYSGEWNVKPLTKQDVEDKLLLAAKSRKTFMFYAWGIWVTAYARRNIWKIISEIHEDVVYTDTDSIKFIGEHEDLFSAYNEEVHQKIEASSKYHGISRDFFAPKTVKGIEKPLGVYEYEGMYDTFKTMGAKKYAYIQDGKLSITISGVTKKAAETMNSIEDFRRGYVFGYNQSGRKILTYNDEQPPILVTDYTGQTEEIKQKFGINLMPTTYKLDIGRTFEDYLLTVNFSSTKATILNERTSYHETEIL